MVFVETDLLPDKFSDTNYEQNSKILNLLEKANKVNDLIESIMLSGIVGDGKPSVNLRCTKESQRYQFLQ